MDWSPHDSNLVAVGSHDGTVQVWGLGKLERLANFRGHTGRVLTVSWSGVSPHVVLSGSADQSMYMWDYTRCAHRSPPASNAKRGTTKSVQSSTPGQSAPVSAGGTPASESTSLRDQHSASGLAESSGESRADSSRRQNNRRSRKPKTLLTAQLGQVRVETSQAAVVELAKAKYQVGQANAANDSENRVAKSAQMALFFGRADVDQMVTTEARVHVAEGRGHAGCTMNLWRGDVIGPLMAACETGTLTEYHLAMAPLAGHDVWAHVTLRYAQQLRAAGEPHTAVGCFLAVHCVNDAIDTYVEAGLYHEAVALAVLRLASTDPRRTDIYLAWARHAEEHGQYEQAAKCYLTIGQVDQAVHVLARRGGQSGLLTACVIATALARHHLPFLVCVAMPIMPKAGAICYLRLSDVTLYVPISFTIYEDPSI